LDDKIFLGVMLYIILSSVIVGMMPTELLYSTTQLDENLDVADLVGFENVTIEPEDINLVTGVGQGITMFGTMFLWVVAPVSLGNIPIFISIIILIINWFCLAIFSIYIFDKFRGIGS